MLDFNSLVYLCTLSNMLYANKQHLYYAHFYDRILADGGTEYLNIQTQLEAELLEEFQQSHNQPFARFILMAYGNI